VKAGKELSKANSSAILQQKSYSARKNGLTGIAKNYKKFFKFWLTLHSLYSIICKTK